ncbi:hypothetical protein [Streptomyces sp. KL116D]|uniref:hypothetical protein n=1 Tax=Streptomyces sp. KL116D TaxID=3045152 RepID=UPI003556EF1D
MGAAHHKLDNLVAVVDRNGWQISGTTEECLSLEPLADRWRPFGWAVREVDADTICPRAARRARRTAGPRDGRRSSWPAP